MTVDPLCVLYGALPESCDHLFSNCVFVRFLLFSVADLLALPDITGEAGELWAKVSDIPAAIEKSKGLTLLAATWWVV